MLLCCSRSPIHHASSDDGSLLVAADARAECIGAKPSRAVMARGLRHKYLTFEGSAVFGTQQEVKTNSLVTMTGTASSSTRCLVRPFLCQSDPERLPACSREICAGLFAGASTTSAINRAKWSSGSQSGQGNLGTFGFFLPLVRDADFTSKRQECA
jgi:hypothetical protein